MNILVVSAQHQVMWVRGWHFLCMSAESGTWLLWWRQLGRSKAGSVLIVVRSCYMHGRGADGRQEGTVAPRSRLGHKGGAAWQVSLVEIPMSH